MSDYPGAQTGNRKDAFADAVQRARQVRRGEGAVCAPEGRLRAAGIVCHILCVCERRGRPESRGRSGDGGDLAALHTLTLSSYIYMEEA